MSIKRNKEVTTVENGTYKANISDVFEYDTDKGKWCLKFYLEDDRVFVYFTNEDELGSFRWNNIFDELDTDNPKEFIETTVEITVANSKSKATGKEFSNIKKIKVAE